MMKFNVNGKEYVSKVSYREDESLRPVNGLFVPVRCTTVQLGEPKDGDIDWFASGESVCMPGDNFRKDVGRHLAAKDAVRFAYATSSVPPTEKLNTKFLGISDPDTIFTRFV